MTDEIVYGVIPRNMEPAGFKGVTRKLADWQELGITSIWLSPINGTPPGDFGYAVTDYFNVRPDYGTQDEFRELVREAHAHNIRVLMDFVPNHTSAQHPYFKDAETHGKASQYYDYYDRDASGAPTHYFNWAHLPNLNFDNPAVEQWILDAFAYWVREFDVDGFRVDVAWGIKERKPDFWPRWREHLTRIKPNLLLIAEAGARDEYYCTHGFDAAYDWTDELGHWAWEHVFDDTVLLTTRLHAALTNGGRGFHRATTIFRFLNNNDTAARFITRYGPEMTRVAAALLLTLPGIPCVYLGDEAGAEFEPYVAPRPIDWTDRHNLRLYYRKLIELRKTIPALQALSWQRLTAAPPQHLYSYLRYRVPGGPAVIVVLNFSPAGVNAEIDLPAAAGELRTVPSLRDMLNDEDVPGARDGTLRVSMPPLSARVIVNAV